MAEELGGALHVPQILRQRILFDLLHGLRAARRKRGHVRAAEPLTMGSAVSGRLAHPLVLLAELRLVLLAQLPVEEVHGGRRG